MNFRNNRIRSVLCAVGITSAAVFLAACSRQKEAKEAQQAGEDLSVLSDQDISDDPGSQMQMDTAEAKSLDMESEDQENGYREPGDRKIGEQGNEEPGTGKQETDRQGDEHDAQRADAKVILGDYTALTYRLEDIVVTQEDVEEQITYLMAAEEPQPDYVYEGTVRTGDIVRLDYEGRIDGARVDGLSSTGDELVVGDGDYPEAFEEQLIGMKVGEEKTFHITFPEDYTEAPGMTVTFTVTVTARAEGYRRADLTDEWAVQNTEYSSMDELRQAVRQRLEQQAEEAQLTEVCSTLITALCAQSQVDIPEDEVEAIVQTQIEAYRQDAQEADMRYEDYVADIFAADTDEFEEELRSEASEEWAVSAVIDAFIEKEEVDVSREAYLQYLSARAEEYGYEDADAFSEDVKAVGYEERIQRQFRERQAGLKLMELCAGRETEET